MNAAFDSVASILGLDLAPGDLTFLQISLRGVIVFIATLVMVRMGDRRFLSRMSAFDAILGFILASMIARAVNGSSAFFPTLGGGFVLVGLHRLMAYFAQDSHWFGNLVKGRSDQIIKDGVITNEVMHKNNLSRHDLVEGMRLNANVEDPASVKAAYLERNGQISVVK